MDSSCEHDSEFQFSWTFDSMFCPICDEWREPSAYPDRPDKPSGVHETERWLARRSKDRFPGE